LTLLVCDVDHLKVINDTMGHSAGDKLIITIGQCLTDSVRPDDLVARISGDEFVVVLHDVSNTTATEMCERIMINVARPVMLTAHTYTTPSVSIGIASGEAGSSGESVFNGADAALYEAKKRGRGRTVEFDDGLRERMLDELQIEQDLSTAFSDGQMNCVYQPEIVVATGALFGFESLARWNQPERGLIEPDRFMPALEPTGNAGRLFDRILEQTLTAQRRWATNLGFHPAVAVNLSASQLANPHLAESVALALIKADAPADQLWLELTETGLADTSALSSLTALHDLGIRLVLDDFGTGWSSMSRLGLYPWDLLKIDRSFIASLGVDPRAEHLVRAMITLAHSLGILTVGEGVETPDQLSRLTDLGCDIVQGFLFSRPVSARAAVDMVDVDGQWTGYPTLAAPA
jgi:diguanylate cyclase (GGDEF)-like protein